MAQTAPGTFTFPPNQHVKKDKHWDFATLDMPSGLWTWGSSRGHVNLKQVSNKLLWTPCPRRLTWPLTKKPLIQTRAWVRGHLSFKRDARKLQCRAWTTDDICIHLADLAPDNCIASPAVSPGEGRRALHRWNKMRLMHVEDDNERRSLMVGPKCQDGMNPPVTWIEESGLRSGGGMWVDWLVSC